VRRRVAELAINRKQLLADVVPQSRYKAISVMASGADRYTGAGVSESGCYGWRGRDPSLRSVRHAWLT
jgi:hypothetical protein